MTQYWVLAYAPSSKAGESGSTGSSQVTDSMKLDWIPFEAAECPFRLFYPTRAIKSDSGNPEELQQYRITLANPRRPSWVLKETANGSKYRA